MSWWVTEFWERDPVLLVAIVFWVIWSIVLHELGHGWAALWAGDDTPRSTGHMTLNPLVHMGLPALLLFALLGVTWGSMPVNPSKFRRSIHEVVVLAAGPAMNLLLFGLCAVAAGFWIAVANGVIGGAHVGEPLKGGVYRFLWMGAQLNVVLCLLNLMPLPVLDGGRMLSYVVPPIGRVFRTNGGMVASLLLVLLVFGTIGPSFWRLGDDATGMVFSAVYRALGGVIPTP
ncbi:site-2 protease family protein [Leptolyngbya sp. 15MV]|nr:site-2 protease family protein [Leptolyngbya sp. 15MV]